jgi:hypothetical protein
VLLLLPLLRSVHQQSNQVGKRIKGMLEELSAGGAGGDGSAKARLGTTETDLRQVASSPANSTSLSRRALRRSYPREEPYAVIPQVRICAGGDQRWSSLPQSRALPQVPTRWGGFGRPSYHVHLQHPVGQEATNPRGVGTCVREDLMDLLIERNQLG